MQSWLNHFSWMTPYLAVLAPVVLSIFSGHLAATLSVLILALASVFILVAPANETEIIAISFYLGSFAIAASGIAARQRAKKLEGQIYRLRKDMDTLSIAARRLFLKELKEERERIRGVRIVHSKTESPSAA